MEMTESKSDVNLWLGGTDCFFNFFKGDCKMASMKKEQGKKVFGLVCYLIFYFFFAIEFQISLYVFITHSKRFQEYLNL